MSILPDAKVQPLEKEKVLLWVLALEQSRMGIMKMRRPVRVSALESDCLGLNLNHQKKKILAMTSQLPSLGLDFLVCKMGVIIVPLRIRCFKDSTS